MNYYDAKFSYYRGKVSSEIKINNISETRLPWVINFASQACYSIEVVNSDTGELVIQSYRGDEFFMETDTIGVTLDSIISIMENEVYDQE